MKKSQRRKLYIDLDGVLIGKNGPHDINNTIAKHAEAFLKYSLKNYDCYWLTTHCKEGDNQQVLHRLTIYADEGILSLASDIKPTSWRTLKTEAIDFQSDFYWMDDGPLEVEMKTLRERNVSDRFILVDTRRNPDDLRRVLSILRKQDKKTV
jgi:hypothetical protein